VKRANQYHQQIVGASGPVISSTAFAFDPAAFAAAEAAQAAKAPNGGAAAATPFSGGFQPNNQYQPQFGIIAPRNAAPPVAVAAPPVSSPPAGANAGNVDAALLNDPAIQMVLANLQRMKDELKILTQELSELVCTLIITLLNAALLISSISWVVLFLFIEKFATSSANVSTKFLSTTSWYCTILLFGCYSQLCLILTPRHKQVILEACHLMQQPQQELHLAIHLIFHHNFNLLNLIFILMVILAMALMECQYHNHNHHRMQVFMILMQCTMHQCQ
jgi:hypothetical protein